MIQMLDQINKHSSLCLSGDYTLNRNTGNDVRGIAAKGEYRSSVSKDSAM